MAEKTRSLRGMQGCVLLPPVWVSGVVRSSLRFKDFWKGKKVGRQTQGMKELGIADFFWRYECRQKTISKEG
jgi:hypothetical protein